MDYNTSRKKLILPEYGRNIHKMVDYAMTIEDRQERNKVAKAIVIILGNMNPHLRDVTDFKHKLWDHLALMSEFKLDIDYPHDTINAEELYKKPNRIPYSTNRIRYKHYGKTVEKLIEEAAGYEEGEERDSLIFLIANHMKKLYLSWNRESVSDEQIFEDIRELSKDRVIVGKRVKLTETKDILQRNKPKVETKPSNNKKSYKKR